MNRPLKCCKMWIDGKTFHLKPSGEISDIYSIKRGEDSKLVTSFRLPLYYCLQLLNEIGVTMKKIAKSTNTVVSIPRNEQEVCTIEGDAEEAIISARNEIHFLIGALRNNLPPKQFLCIPTKNEEIVSNFNKFKNEILNDSIHGVEESIFQSPQKLHLTIAVTCLMDHEILEAQKALEDYNEQVLKPLFLKTGPLKIELCGINTMNQNLRNTHVLFADAKLCNENEDLNLQKLVNGISNFFYERGLLKEYHENVTIHATLMNTKYRKNTNSRSKWAKRQSFDASPILENYKDFYFGICDFSALHLSLMSEKGDDGFYKPLGIAQFQ